MGSADRSISSARRLAADKTSRALSCNRVELNHEKMCEVAVSVAKVVVAGSAA